MQQFSTILRKNNNKQYSQATGASLPKGSPKASSTASLLCSTSCLVCLKALIIREAKNNEKSMMQE
jgi:hypothetical protein